MFSMLVAWLINSKIKIAGFKISKLTQEAKAKEKRKVLPPIGRVTSQKDLAVYRLRGSLLFKTLLPLKTLLLDSLTSREK